VTPLALLLALAPSQALDEDALFSDSSVVEAERPAAAATKDSVLGTSVRLGGGLEAVGQASWKRGAALPSRGAGLSSLVGTANLDVRLAGGERALAIFELDHDGTADTASWALRELFLDADVGGVVWFRAGKQVLQWGRGILWTPTDLVNVEGRTLVERPGAREGATGLKVQIPFGTRGSFSAFAPLHGVDQAESLSVALRGEVVLGRFEVALSTRLRQDAPHAWGVDASTGVAGFDVQGGALWLSGDPEPRAALRDGAWRLEKDPTRAQVRASGGIGRAFKVGGVPDRLRIDVEGYWQSESYGSEVLGDAGSRPFADTLWMDFDPALVAGARANGIGLPRGFPIVRGDGLTFLAGNGLLVPNRHGPLYLGGMASYGKFLIPDLVLSAQALSNLEDGSGAGALGGRWESLHGFHVMPMVWWFWGDRRTEFVLDGRGLGLELRSGLRF